MPCRSGAHERRAPAWMAPVILALCLAVASVAAAAQTSTSTTGAIKGTVTDITGAVLPGVTVRLSGTSLITDATTVTDAAGVYRFSAVPPGEHILTFELAGFGTLVRAGVHVGLGFTATANAAMRPGAVTDTVDVSSAPAVIDPASTSVTSHFTSERLATLPGSRDFFAVVANTPGIAMSKVDVGGNAALSLQDYTTYGLRAATGMNRNEVEGIRVGAANGTNDNYLPDFASFGEIVIKAAGNSPAMPVPGTLSHVVTKSGGNAYHGSMHLGFQNDSLEAANIDDGQIARGVSGGPGLDVRDINRLEQFRDFNADVGGYLKKGKAWWYGAYRSTAVAQRYAWLLDDAARLEAEVGTGKLTYQLSPRQKLVGYFQYQTFQQSSFFTANLAQPIATSDALPRIDFPVSVWKGEYNAAVTDAIYVEARAGGFRSDADVLSRSAAARVSDPGANTVSGGAASQGRLTHRPQLSGSLSYSKTGWWGDHTLKVGGEFMADHSTLPHDGYLHSCNCVSTFNNGVPTQVQVFLGPNVSKNELTTSAGYVDDRWRVSPRITLALGIRLDRYQPILPPQEGPAGQQFTAIDPVLTFTNWGPRAGVTTDLTGNGKTVLKLHYGKYWLYPGPNFTATFNPNASGWSRTYRWPADANANGRWDAGEEGTLVSVAGGTASTRLDPEIDNTYVTQVTGFIEREVASNVGLRTGVVLNARRQTYGTVNVSRPLSAYSVPVPVVDPGPDGRPGSADDGATVTAYNLSREALGLSPVNLTTNLADSTSEYYTWEVTATKHQRGRWSLLASFTTTWSREAALGTGNDYTPNALLHSEDGQDRFTTWQAKVNGTLNLPWGLMVVPVLRHQSGSPFARTFVQSLNYGNATLKAEPVAASRTPDITLVDVRTEKTLRLGRTRVMGFVDLYNLFNTNAEQTLTTSSGGAWLRPTSITGPRILRLGARLEW